MKVRNYWPMALLLFLVIPSFSQDGRLDPTFGQGGIVLPELPEYTRSFPTVVRTRPDGRILVAGNAVFGKDIPGTPYDVYLLQYLPDGSPDLSFGSGGMVRETFSEEGDFVSNALLQPDGKILTTGFFTRSVAENMDVNTNVFIARYLPDGTRDTTFGTGGLVTAQLNKAADLPQDLFLQPDGKLVVGGYFYNNRSRESFMLRYLPDGTPDPEFADNGRLILRFPEEGAGNGIQSILLQADGKFLGAGDRLGQPMMVRLLPNGEQDTQFAEAGVFYLDLGLPNASIDDVVQYANGRILAVVNSFEWDGPIGRERPTLIQLSPEGELDESFAESGRRMLTTGDTAMNVQQMLLQVDGKLLLSGRLRIPAAEEDEAFLLRLRPDGTRDQNFGQGGLVVYRPGTNNYVGRAVALQEDGKILLGGSWHEAVIYNYMPFLLRFENVKPLAVSDRLSPFSEVQVFPNPSLGRSTLRFQLDRTERVTILVYDLWGRVVVKVLENELLGAGAHLEPLSFPEGVAAGVYVLEVATASGRVRLKMVRK